jgi:hypothetical protein
MAQYNLGPKSTESEVEDGFKAGILPAFDSRDVLRRVGRYPMDKNVVPNTGSDHIVSCPIPDVLYGYNLHAFPQQQVQIHVLKDEITPFKLGLMYPFLVTEFTGFTVSGHSSGNLLVAKNQCLGGSASCVNIAERLNSQLRGCRDNVPPINSAVFSIAMNGTSAELYISWKHNNSYYMQRVKNFTLDLHEEYLLFRTVIWNIIDWGKNERLTEIQNSLDSLLEDHRRRTSEVAKSRSPPLGDDSGSEDDRRKTPRMREMSDHSQAWLLWHCCIF